MSKPIMLIVDDIEVNREPLAVCFSQQFVILQASNGKEAMDCMKKNSGNVAIILLDMIMPEMGGIDFLKWISTSAYHNVPVIAFTAEERYQLEALENGAWDFITKPIEMSILKARVNNVLGRYGFLHEKQWNAALETANLELEKANWRMNHLVNSIPGGIAVYRMTDRFQTVYFSDGVAELSGYTREEYAKWIREDAFCAVFEPDRAHLLTVAVEKLAKGKSIDETYRIYHKDGSLVWVRLNGIPMESEQEETLIYAVFQSVSPQTKFYQSVLDETHTAVYACDANTYEILYFNRQMATLVGVESAAVTGKICYEYLFHRDAPCTFCQMKQMEKGKMLEREFFYPVNHCTYQMRGKLVEWNQITAHVEYIEDITQKKETEAKNAALLAQLASIMDNVPGALCLYRLRGDTLEPIIHNQAFYRVLGYSGENVETVNRSTNFLNVHPDDLAGLQAKIGEGIRCFKAVQHTYRLYHDEKGCYVWLRLNARVVDQEDGTKLIYCTYTDVTEEKESEQIAVATRERSEQQYRRQMRVIDGIQLPVTPCKISLKTGNNNKVLELINEGEINFLRTPGLSEVSFECLIPQQPYPFAVYPDGFHAATYYLERLEELKVKKRSFFFQVVRETPGGKMLFNNNLTVSLEDYTITEDAKNGMDLMISIKLKEFREFATGIIKLEKTADGKTIGKVQRTRPVTREIPKTYTVKKGDTLWKICRAQLGDGGRCWEIAKKNGIGNPNMISVGQVLKLD